MIQLRTLGLLGLLAWAALRPFGAYAQTPCCSGPIGSNTATCAASKACFELTPTTWLTLSGEYRARYETLDPQDFGISRGVVSNSIANRALLGAELRDGNGFRAVFQVSAADQNGREPGPRSFDESAIDIAQAYVDLPVNIAGAKLTTRLGRQELALGNRLISLRDGVILRRAFDGVRFDLDVDGQKFIAVHASPVQNRPGAFDDEPIKGERFNAVIWQSSHPITTGRWSAYFLDRERALGRYVQVSGAERRQNYGLQYSKRTQTFDLTAQGSLQFGQVAKTDVAAFGFSVDMGWTTQSPNPLRYGLQFGYASGDDDTGDDTLNTFDPLYPNLGAFTDAPLYFYANQFNVQASVTKTMGDLILRSEVTMLGRPTGNDAIFSSSGRPLLVSLQTPELSAVAFDISARWRIASSLELYASALHARALDGVTKAGGRDTNFFMLQLTTGF